MNNEALSIVMSAPQSEWGERWIVAEKVMKDHDGQRPVSNYLQTCLRYKRIDNIRRKGKHFPGINVESRILDATKHAPTIPDKIEISTQLAKALEEIRNEEFLLAARGMKLQQIAVYLNKPIGTVKSNMSRGRRQLCALIEGC